MLVKERNGRKVMAKRLDRTDEIFQYCESDGRKEKETSMRTRFQQRFEQELEQAAAALTKKGGTKKYPKVMERIGRLKERYPMTARFYKIEVTRKGELADSITLTLEKIDEADIRFSGSCYLRSDRDDLREKEHWPLYTMLTRLEDSFRTMKSELGFRIPPGFSPERRTDGGPPVHLGTRISPYRFHSEETERSGYALPLEDDSRSHEHLGAHHHFHDQ